MWPITTPWFDGHYAPGLALSRSLLDRHIPQGLATWPTSVWRACRANGIIEGNGVPALAVAPGRLLRQRPGLWSPDDL